jgi:hypothetical protein
VIVALVQHEGIAAALAAWTREAPLSLELRGGSMAPTLPEHGRVRVAAAGRLWPGDILVVADAHGQLVAHRLLGSYRRHGRRLVLRGDAAPSCDAPVAPGQVIGRVVWAEGRGALEPVPLGARLRAMAGFAAFVASRVWGRIA